MKLNQLIKADEAIFSTLKQLDGDKFQAAFGDADPDILDLDFFSHYGERTIAPLVKSFVSEGVLVGEGMQRIGKVLYSRYYEKWRRLYTTLTTDYDVLRPYNIVDMTTEEGESASTNENETMFDSDVYGYNSANPVDDKDSRTSDSGKNENKHTLKRTYERHGNIGNTSYSELIQKELAARESNYLDIVFQDVAEMMTLQIYE